MAEGGGFEIDAKRFYAKLKNMQSMVYFFENIHLDAAAYLQQKEINEVLNGQYVRRISGNLRRSQEVIPVSPVLSVVATELSIAPYALAVLERTRRKYGRNFLRITLDLFAGEVQRLMRAEFDRMMEVINSGQPYKYQNPFPDA